MHALKGLPPRCPTISEIGGATWSISDKLPNRAFNPSIAYSNKYGYVMAVRRTNYWLDTEYGSLSIHSGARGVRNVTEITRLDSDLTPTEWHRVQFVGGPELIRGVEDCRIISRDGEWYINAVMLEQHTPRARICLYKMSNDFEASYVDTFEGAETDKPEKNWMTYHDADSLNFDFVKGGPDGIRGGSSLISYENGYLALCHRTYLSSFEHYNPLTFGIQKGVKRNYTHVFVSYDLDLNVVATSEEFTFRPEGGIEFGSGLIQKGEELYITYGVDDKESWMAKIDLDKVKKLMKELNK